MPGSSLSAPREVRFRWYLQVEKYGKTIDEVCNIFGISRKTYYKWYLRDHGLGSNQYRSRKVHPQTKLSPKIRVEIWNVKTELNYGPKKMKFHLKEKFDLNVSTTAIYKFLKRKRLIKKPQRKQPWYTPMKEPFFASKPGENIELDVKYVPGEDQSWNYQFRFIDTFTNWQYAVDCLDKSAETTIYAFKLAKQHFPFTITGIQTDNGGEFRGKFAIYLQSLGITHRFIPKRSAPWNGQVERANRSVDDEFYLNPNRPWKTLAEYTHWWNHERYSEGKGMNGLTPYRKLQRFLLTINQNLSPLKVN